MAGCDAGEEVVAVGAGVAAAVLGAEVVVAGALVASVDEAVGAAVGSAVGTLVVVPAAGVVGTLVGEAEPASEIGTLDGAPTVTDAPPPRTSGEPAVAVVAVV